MVSFKLKTSYSNKRKIHFLLLLLVVTFITTSCSNKLWYEELLHYEDLEKYDESNQIIAFIDTGISNKVEGQYNIIGKYNSITGTSNASDDNGHGTAIISAACGDGTGGVEGLAPKAKILIIKAADEEGIMNFESLYKGLNYAQKNGADVVNISLGGYISSKKIEKKIYKMYNDGITIVAAVGDYSQKDLLFPVRVSPFVVSVAALDEQAELWENSNIDDALVCAFPGVNIQVLDINARKCLESGTSEATALATAYIAKMKAAYMIENDTEITNKQIEGLLQNLGTIDNSDTNFMRPFSIIERGNEL